MGLAAELDMGRLFIKRLKVWGSTLRSPRQQRAKPGSCRAARKIVAAVRAWPAATDRLHREYPIQQVEKALPVQGNATVGKVILRFVPERLAGSR